MIRFGFFSWRTSACLALAAGFGVGWGAQRWAIPPVTGGATPAPAPVAPGREAKPPLPLSGIADTGSESLMSLADALAGGATPDRLAATARQWLREGRHHCDESMWGLLLAHWAIADGDGLIAFVENETLPAEREWLRDRAWQARGAATPAAAFEAGRDLPPAVMRKLLAGIAESDPALAAEYVWQVPDAQFMVWAIAEQVVTRAPELVDDLLQRAVYDGARVPLQQAQLDVLARTDPEGALTLARKMGLGFGDPVSNAIGLIAAHAPETAADMVDAMTSSRSKALSAVTLAGVWAARDADAALDWVRTTQYGPVRHAALVQAAAARGSADPSAGLAILNEAGWDAGGDFFKIVSRNTTFGHVPTAQTVVKTAGSLLQQLALLDPAAARQYLTENVPDEFRAEVSTLSGVAP